jgi:hypothetical protein
MSSHFPWSTFTELGKFNVAESGDILTHASNILGFDEFGHPMNPSVASFTAGVCVSAPTVFPANNNELTEDSSLVVPIYGLPWQPAFKFGSTKPSAHASINYSHPSPQLSHECTVSHDGFTEYQARNPYTKRPSHKNNYPGNKYEQSGHRDILFLFPDPGNAFQGSVENSYQSSSMYLPDLS